MLIIFFLIFQYVLLLYKSKWDKKLIYIIGISTVLCVISLLLLQLELSNEGRMTYGTDETDYFSTMLYASKMTDLGEMLSFLWKDFNFTYVLFGTLILKTSLFDSIILVRLANVLLFLNTILFSYFLAKKYLRVSTNSLYFILSLVGTNGILIWTAIRVLKDPLFIYFFVIFIYIILELFSKKRFTFFGFLIFVITFYVLTDIRQWFIYFFIFLISILLMIELYKKKRYFYMIVLGAIAFIVLLNFAEEGFQILDAYITTRGLSVSLFSLPIFMAQFLMGPGPVRALFGNTAFMFTTTIGNFLITLGSAMWWIYVPIFIMSLFSLENIKKYYILFASVMFYWVLYSYANAGSGDTRIRGVFYILAMLFSLPYLNKNNNKKLIFKTLIIGIPLWLGSIYYSYLSLS